MGTNKANPSAMVLSATMMLRHLGLETQANTIASAVYDVISEGKVRTADMRGGEFIQDRTGSGADGQ
jgi:isocitrate dehydrogenase (NAD+)